MKHSLYFFLTITLCITTTSIAMEPKLPETKKYLASENIFTTLTIIEEPQKDQFLTNDHVVIKNETQCNICDTFFNPSDTATFATHWPQKPCTITKLNIT